MRFDSPAAGEMAPGTLTNRMRTNLSLPRIALAAAAILLALAMWFGRVAIEIRQSIHLPEIDYAQSTVCQVCHPDRYASWHQTFHRTMTQLASPQSVLGNFENSSYTYQGVTSSFQRTGDAFVIETLSPAGERVRYPVVLTIGSRRIQQYVTRIDDRHIRLPLAWDIEAGRWFHLNGGFLHPDGADFHTHTALWDGNCIFCHNVKARPGYHADSKTYNSSVAELGIACEACHGPAEEHVRRNSDPLRRYLLYLGDRDRTIYSPAELPTERQTQICGHCHGQRLPNPIERIEQFVSEGDPYTAGDDLGEYTSPIFIDSQLAGVDLSLRFWQDGTPRLTAYEYQGILLSNGHENTELTCISCHNMHGGDPRGMIDQEMRGPQACIQCHEEYRSTQAIQAHTRHDPAGSGSSCYACHMPPMVYGILDIHPSHRIQNPDPSRSWRDEMPDACTLCHSNQPARWAAEQQAILFDQPARQDLPQDEAFHIAESIRTLLSGDVIQRAVAVEALAAPQSYTGDPVARLWAVPFLLITLEDNYPALRQMAYRGLLQLAEEASGDWPEISGVLSGAPDFDALSEPVDRQPAIDHWWAWWMSADRSRIPHPGPSVPLDASLRPIPQLIEGLVAQQDQKIISIGE